MPQLLSIFVFNCAFKFLSFTLFRSYLANDRCCELHFLSTFNSNFIAVYLHFPNKKILFIEFVVTDRIEDMSGDQKSYNMNIFPTRYYCMINLFQNTYKEKSIPIVTIIYKFDNKCLNIFLSNSSHVIFGELIKEIITEYENICSDLTKYNKIL